MSKIIELEVKDKKVKKPSIFKRIGRGIVSFWNKIKYGVLCAIMYVGIIIVCCIPYLIYYAIIKRSYDKQEKIYYNEEEGFAVVMKRWLTEKECAYLTIRKKRGEKEYDILKDLDVIKEDIT